MLIVPHWIVFLVHARLPASIVGATATRDSFGRLMLQHALHQSQT